MFTLSVQKTDGFPVRLSDCGGMRKTAAEEEHLESEKKIFSMFISPLMMELT